MGARASAGAAREYRAGSCETRRRAAPARAGRRAGSASARAASRGCASVRKDRQQGAQREDDAPDPDPAHETVHLELDGRLAAVAREVTEDDVDVLLEAEPVVDVGDRRLLLRVELLGGLQRTERAAVRDGERPDHLEVIRLL